MEMHENVKFCKGMFRFKKNYIFSDEICKNKMNNSFLILFLIQQISTLP